jgi:hypothetical protein
MSEVLKELTTLIVGLI